MAPLALGLGLGLSRGRYPASDLLTVQKYGTPAFLLDNRNPGILTPSGLARSYQDFAGTVADTSTQTAALALDLSEGAAIGAELVTNGVFDTDSDWGKVSGATIADGVADLPFGGGQVTQVGTTAEAGGLYQITVDLVERTGNSSARITFGGTNTSLFTAVQTHTFYVLAASTGSLSAAALAGSSGSIKLDNISIKRVSGNHFYQATSADEPTLTFANGQWGYVGDGTSKHFKTGLVPAASMTIMAAVQMDAASDIILGAEVGANAFRTGTDSTNVGRYKIGSSAANFTTSSIVGVAGVMAIRAAGSSFYAYWKPFGGAAETSSGSFAGSIPTGQSLYVGSSNDDGSSVLPFDGTIWRALAQQSAYTDAEIAAIANQWSRELASLA